MGLVQRTERRTGKEIAQPKPAHGCSPAYMASGGKVDKWIQKTGVDQNKGGLHRATHTPMGEKIPAAKIEAAAHSQDPHVRHMAQFAKNVKK